MPHWHPFSFLDFYTTLVALLLIETNGWRNSESRMHSLSVGYHFKLFQTASQREPLIHSIYNVISISTLSSPNLNSPELRGSLQRVINATVQSSMLQVIWWPSLPVTNTYYRRQSLPALHFLIVLLPFHVWTFSFQLYFVFLSGEKRSCSFFSGTCFFLLFNTILEFHNCAFMEWYARECAHFGFASVYSFTPRVAL